MCGGGEEGRGMCGGEGWVCGGGEEGRGVCVCGKGECVWVGKRGVVYVCG